MKKTGKTLTLSGQMPKRDFGAQLYRDPHTILEYANVLDINKAWKVKDFRVWIMESNFGQTADAYFTVDTQLSTDDIPNLGDWNNAGDNRAIGWGTLAYNCNAMTSKPQSAAGFPRSLENSEYFMHPDHLIQNKLTISAHAFGDQSTLEQKQYTLNYIVYLEEYDITPTESIIFNIKGKAQDLSS
tara:strand:+ start:123 stop:677 length:555 start_codon:yes stop_codon:yes gene_type:complete